ncbi:MAG TPA: 2-oxoacid:acceptor oxidoreductase subunit alpha [Pseudobdellovibrionaceae bacterium]|nr:2-oxoacid:acceptor oxidoreductase subunit alpha [Pseudobdellovibrionaceae bacterium]
MGIQNDFVINIATVNGSGSQSANLVLLKSLFKMGIPVGGKNVFPSNIAGLPTWFWIRANEKGYTGRREKADIVIAMNPQTLAEDLHLLRDGGIFIYNSDIPMVQNIPAGLQVIAVPFKKLVDQATDIVKIKKLLINIIYVGVVSELLGLDESSLLEALKDQLGSKQKVFDENLKALNVGREYAKNNLDVLNFSVKAQKMNANKNKIMIDGNTAAAIGSVMGGCTFGAWYPITPSSSLMEGFIKYSHKYRQDENNKNRFAIIQAEDELASICMVLGAGWAGARAMTATSGPGLSLMQEAAGFAYYSEIPGVIWDVQRVGPSTGMPTRTMQGDLFTAMFASHGDTKHPCLIPGNPNECYEFGQLSFDLAERLQQLVIVLSDLDIGMNLWLQDEFTYPQKAFDRGKVLTAEQLDQVANYERYGDPDGDGIPYRVLPGNHHPKAGYTIRGSGHNAKAQYTESSKEYKWVVDRLNKKWETARTLVPEALALGSGNQKIGILIYGSTEAVIQESMDLLAQKGISVDSLRIRALPFTKKIENFISQHERVYVIDQNRDGQMFQLLRMDYSQFCSKFNSIKHYDGTPITADFIVHEVSQLEKDQAEKERQGA